MNPLLVEALKSIFRWILTIAATYLVSRGIWTQENAVVYVGAAATALVTLLWSLWQHYGMRLKFVTAASEAGLSEHQIEAMVKDPGVVNPPVSAPKNEVPVAPAALPVVPVPAPEEKKP